MKRQRRADERPDGDARPAVESKRQVRQRFLDRRRDYPHAEATDASRVFLERLGALPEFAEAGRVALYAAIPGAGELDLHPVFEDLRAGGRVVLYPRCLPDHRLEFVEVRDWGALRPGRHGIPEPEGSAVPLHSDEDLVLVPGLAFDRSGVRLGRGGGYFDRTFAPGAEFSPRLFGVGYSWQLTEEALPRESHDRRMDGILTDQETLRIPNPRPGEPD